MESQNIDIHGYTSCLSDDCQHRDEGETVSVFYEKKSIEFIDIHDQSNSFIHSLIH